MKSKTFSSLFFQTTVLGPIMIILDTYFENKKCVKIYNKVDNFFLNVLLLDQLKIRNMIMIMDNKKGLAARTPDKKETT